MSLSLYLDESVRGDTITVGGFFVATSEIPALVKRLHALKVRIGLKPDDELKHTYGKKDDARLKLDAAGLSRSALVPLVLDWIASQPVVIVANTNYGGRPDIKAADLYCDAMNHCIRQFANVVQWEHPGEGPHHVTVDTPPENKKKPPKDVGDRLRLLANAKHAAHALYERRWHETEPFPSGRTAPAYSQLDLAPSLATAMARHNPLLQIADFVAGTMSEWADAYLSDDDLWNVRGRDFRDDNMKLLLPVARRYRSRCWTYGIAVFPSDHWHITSLASRLSELEVEVLDSSDEFDPR